MLEIKKTNITTLKLYKLKFEKILILSWRIIIEIADKNNVSVYGSFNPKNIPCNGNEYFDEIHLMSSCSKKIENFLNASK